MTSCRRDDVCIEAFGFNDQFNDRLNTPCPVFEVLLLLDQNVCSHFRFLEKNK